MTKEVQELVPVLTNCYMSDILISDKICCKVQIETPLGSAVSILPKQLYQECLAECPLMDPKACLVTYSKDIPELGCMPMSVMPGDVTTSATFHIIQAGSALLGIDSISFELPA